MSHYTTLRTAFVSAEHLALALGDLGFNAVETHELAQPLVGWKGDRRVNKAEIIVRREHVGPASNDIGFARRADGRFEALISDWDRRRYGKRWLGRLAQRYAYRVSREALARQGFDLVDEEVDAENRIHLCVRRTA